MEKLDFTATKALISQTAEEIVTRIKGYMADNNVKVWNFTKQGHSVDSIYAYIFVNDEAEEQRIVGLVLDGDSLNVVTTAIDDDKPYEDDDILNDKCVWFRVNEIFGGEMLGYYTAFNLAEYLGEYDLTQDK